MNPRIVEPLSKVEFDRLSVDQQSQHVQDTLAALQESIPQTGAAAGMFIDIRLYVQELLEWVPTQVERLWPLHSAGIEGSSEEILAAFQEALDSGSLSPAQAEFAEASLQAARGPADLYDEYA